MITYVPRTFLIDTDYVGKHEFNGYEAKDVGLGYYINPVKGILPEDVVKDLDREGMVYPWYILVHVKSLRSISGSLKLTEEAIRYTLEEIAPLTDWNADLSIIDEDKELVSKCQEIFDIASYVGPNPFAIRKGDPIHRAEHSSPRTTTTNVLPGELILPVQALRTATRDQAFPALKYLLIKASCFDQVWSDYSAFFELGLCCLSRTG